MQVPDSEGRANHTGPESCAGTGNGVGEALTGEGAGRVLSLEIGRLLGADVVRTHGRPYGVARKGEGYTDQAGSETSGMHGNTLR